MSFSNHSTTFSTFGGHGHRYGHRQHVQLNELQKFSIFSDQVNLSRFLNALATPMVYSLDFKCTTGAISSVLSEITKLGERSGWYGYNDGSGRTGGLRKLGICVPSVGAAEESIAGWLMSDTSTPSFNTGLGVGASSGGFEGLSEGKIQETIEELALESWQGNVAGLLDSFLMKMNPERRVRSIKTYSYPLDGNDSPMSSSTSTPRSRSTSNTGSTHRTNNSAREAVIVSPGWVDVPTDEVREVVEQLVEVPQGEFIQPHEILLPNLVAMTYRGTLSFTTKVLKETIYTRWNRKSRTRTVQRLVKDNERGKLQRWLGGVKEHVITEEEEYFPTVELKAFDIHIPEMEDLKELIDEETNLVFRKMLREGFCLSIETKRGLMAF